MNLIEPTLAHVMRKLSHSTPTTLRELRMRVYQIWDNTQGFHAMERLYDGMTRRVNA